MDKESVLNIMKMVKDGTITPEEATELIKALTDKTIENTKGNASKSKKGKLVIHVIPKSEKGEKANITIPLGMAKIFLKKFVIDKGIDVDLKDVEESGIHVETDDEIVDISVE